MTKIDFVDDTRRAHLAALLLTIDRETAKADALDAKAEQARAAAARFRADAKHPELEPVSDVATPSADRLDDLMAGAKPAALDHRARANLRESNENRSAVRRQIVADADALEEHAGVLHAQAEEHRKVARAARQDFFNDVARALLDNLRDAMRGLILGPMCALDALRSEASRHGLRAPGTIGLVLDANRLTSLGPRGPMPLWPLAGSIMPTGDRIDPAASYARLIEEIRAAPAEDSVS